MPFIIFYKCFLIIFLHSYTINYKLPMISLRELFESKINYFVRYNKKNDYTFYTFLKKKCKIQIIKDLYLDRKWFIDHISRHK